MTLTLAATIAAAVRGAVAALLALAAYWSASGKARLSAELGFDLSEVDAPMLGISNAPDGDWFRVIRATRATVILRNSSRCAARNHSVFISLRGFNLPAAPDGWRATSNVDGLGVKELIWEGEPVHGDTRLYRFQTSF